MAGTKLKKCAHCKGEAKHHDNMFGKMHFHYIRCITCHMQTPAFADDALSAFQIWNRRDSNGPKEHDSGPLQCY